MSERGPDNQKIYYATARCKYVGHTKNCVLSRAVYGHDIGVGSSSSRDGAKNQAAAAALKLLRSTGVEGFIR